MATRCRRPQDPPPGTSPSPPGPSSRQQTDRLEGRSGRHLPRFGNGSHVRTSGAATRMPAAANAVFVRSYLPSDRKRLRLGPQRYRRPTDPGGGSGRCRVRRRDRSASACSSSPSTPSTPTIRRTVAEAEEVGVDVVFNWDHFYPAVRRARRHALRVLDHARRLGRGDRARRDRRPRHLQLLPQPRPAGRHGAHGRPHHERPADPRHRRPAGSSRTTTSTATSSARRAAGSTRSATALPRIEQRLGQAQPGADPRHPGPHRRRRRDEDAAAVAQHADIWHGFGDARDDRAQARTCSTSGAPSRPRPGRDRALDAGVPRGPGREVGTGAVDVGTRLFTVGIGGPHYDLSGHVVVPWRDSL